MADVEALLDPSQRRQLKLEIEQLAADGYGRADLVDYAKGFKDGYSTSSPVGFAGKVANGLLSGYGDELKGMVRPLMTGNSRMYETGRARAQLARASNDAPITSLGLEVAGSIAPAVVGGGLISKALGPAAGLAGNIGRGAAAGAIQGGVYGAGNEVGGLEARAAGAIPGAVVGGLVGGAVVPAAELGLSVARRAGAAIFPSGGEAQAQRALRTAISETAEPPMAAGMRRPGSVGAAAPGPMQPSDYARVISSRMRDAQAGGTPLTMAEGIGQQGVDLLETAAQAPGPGREQIIQQLAERQMAQPGRLVDALRRSSGVAAGSVDTMQAVRQARGDAARPLYESMGGIDMPDDLMQPFWSFLQTNAGRRAYGRAADFAQQAKVRGEPFGQLPSFDALKNGARLTVGEADVILQGLEAVAEKRMTPSLLPGGKSPTKDSIAYNKTAEFLRNQMRARIPEFEAARATWAGPTQFIESIKQGEKALGLDLDTFKTVFAKANAAQQEGIKIGLVNSIKSDLEQYAAGPTADASRNLARRYAVREKLRLAIGSEADDLLKVIDTEAKTSATAAQTMGNSATARRQAAQEALGEDPVNGTPTTATGIIGRVVGKLDEFARRNTRNAVARLGLTTDPDEAAALVESIMSGPPSRPRGTIPGAILGGPAGAAGGAIATDR